MASKKAGGSTKNGRDSHSKRLGVKRFGGGKFLREQSSFVNVEQNSTWATMLKWVVTTRSILLSMVLLNLNVSLKSVSKSVFILKLFSLLLETKSQLR